VEKVTFHDVVIEGYGGAIAYFAGHFVLTPSQTHKIAYSPEE